MEKEIRSIDVDFRSAGDNRTIDGYAIVFNSLSHDLGGFFERVLPEAVDDGVIERSDVLALLNHDSSRGILGRSRNGNGSLQLKTDEHGLRFVVDAPRTALGDECLEYLRRGDATQCSFAFTVAEDSWEKQVDGTYIRTIKKFDRLYDCSILTCTPAYEATSVSCRSFDEFKAAEAKAEEEARAAEEARKAEEERLEAEKREAEEAEKEAKLKAYFDQLRQEYAEALEKSKLMNGEDTK